MKEPDPQRAPSAPRAGTVVSVNVSERKAVRKVPVSRALLVEGRGLDGDAHAGDWHRQVSLLGQESIDKMVATGLSVSGGDFAENLTTSGVNLPSLPVGSVVAVGEQVVLRISQIGKECHTKCAIYRQAGDCVMPTEGVFATVERGGTVEVGDALRIGKPSDRTEVDR